MAGPLSHVRVLDLSRIMAAPWSAQILADLGLKKIRLLTNNPKKIVGLEGYGLEVVERVSLVVRPNAANEKYLRTKRDKLGHVFS